MAESERALFVKRCNVMLLVVYSPKQLALSVTISCLWLIIIFIRTPTPTPNFYALYNFQTAIPPLVTPSRLSYRLLCSSLSVTFYWTCRGTLFSNCSMGARGWELLGRGSRGWNLAKNKQQKDGTLEKSAWIVKTAFGNSRSFDQMIFI